MFATCTTYIVTVNALYHYYTFYPNFLMNVFTQVGQAPNIETNVLKSMMMDVLMK